MQAEPSLRIVPRQGDLQPLAPPVRERAAVVFVVRTGAIGTGIDDNREWRVQRLIRVLAGGPDGHESARAHVEGHRGEIHRAIDLAATFDPLAAPVVVPRTTRQIQPATRGAPLHHRRDQQVSAPQVLVATRQGHGIVVVVEPQRAHHRESGFACVFHGGVGVGEKLIAQLEIALDDRLDILVVELGRIDHKPSLGRAAVAAIPSPGQAQMPVAAVRTKRRAERAELKPSHVQLPGQFRSRNEPADVCPPVWDSRETGVHGDGHMRRERLPARLHVARPEERAVARHARRAVAMQGERALVGPGSLRPLPVHPMPRESRRCVVAVPLIRPPPVNSDI